MVCLQGENALFCPATSLSLAHRFLSWISSLRNPWAEEAAKQEGPEELKSSLFSVDDSWSQYERVVPS
jgi:hypothetical protein